MKEEHDEVAFGESTTNYQLHILNEILINLFGKGTDSKIGPSTTFFSTNNHCQLCHLEKYVASTCPKLVDTKPKCAKCRGGHKIDNCGLKCSFYFDLGHMEDWCWKKFAKGPSATTNFLEILVDDDEATFSKLNWVCGGDQHVFSGVKIPKKRLLIATNPTKEQEEGVVDEYMDMNIST
jgi:hypothetical protein